MTNPDDLLAAIIADPANDDLRLVFADLLDDRGEGERASFIRVQVELAKLCQHCGGLKWRAFLAQYDPHGCDFGNNGYIEPCSCVDEKESRFWGRSEQPSKEQCDEAIRAMNRIRRRELAILDKTQGGVKNRYRWVEEQVPGWHVKHPSHVVYSRGFATHITCTYDDWARHADAITARCPIERVELTTWPQSYGTFLNNNYKLIGVNNSAAVTHEESLSASMQWQDLAAELVKRTWPRITFTLPSEVAV